MHNMRLLWNIVDDSTVFFSTVLTHGEMLWFCRVPVWAREKDTKKVEICKKKLVQNAEFFNHLEISLPWCYGLAVSRRSHSEKSIQIWVLEASWHRDFISPWKWYIYMCLSWDVLATCCRHTCQGRSKGDQVNIHYSCSKHSTLHGIKSSYVNGATFY
jgi:hypothetical protein